MKKFAYYVLAILIASALVGCGSTPKERIITKTETTFVSIPKTLLAKDIERPVPPTKVDYVAMTREKKEEALSTLISNLYKTIDKYNNKLDKALEYQDKELKNQEEAKGKK